MSAGGVQVAERDSGPSFGAASGLSAPAGGSSSSSAVKLSLSGWDSQLRLQSAQQRAVSQLTQSVQARTAALHYPPLKQPTYTARLAKGTGQHSSARPSPAHQLWSLAPLDSTDSSFQPAASPQLSPQSWEQQLLSAYLTSPSQTASTPSAAYSLLVASHSQLSSLVSLSSSLLSHLSLLHQHHATVHEQTNKVREECAALLAEQKELLASADRYAANLHYFDQAERIAAQLQHTLTVSSSSHTSTQLDAAAFPAILSSIDQCTHYLHHNHSFHASQLYLGKYERLKERLLRLVRQYVNDTLNDAEKADRADREKERLASKAKAASSEGGVSGDSGRQSSWLRSFVTHRALAPLLSPLIRDIERRAAEAPGKSLYASTLAEVQQLYMQQRQRLVVAALSEYVATLSKERELTALTRAAVSALLSLCSLESQLFDVLFSDVSRPLLSSLLSSLASILYTALRPLVIRQTDIDVLCEVIIILKEETASAAAVSQLPTTPHSAAPSPTSSSSASSASSPSSAAASSTPASSDSYLSVLRRLIGDCQERLSYRASAFIRDGVAGYKNTQRDVDWRARLDKLNAKHTAANGGRQEQAEEKDASEQQSGASSKEEKSVDGSDDVSLAEWHPALERTLITLSKLYRCLEPNVFKILAQEAIAECLNQLIACERLVAAQPPAPQPADASKPPTARPPSSSSAALHASLWLIQQLLTLNSQLSPFPLDLSSPHKQHALDFSHMAQSLPTLFSSSAKWTSFSELVQLSTPRVHEVRSDSKRAVHRLLREACERCIAQLTQLTIGPLVAFFQRTAQKQQAGAGSDGEQFRAELCSIMDQLTAEQTGLAAVMLDLRRLVHAYLFSPIAEGRLFTPVKQLLMETAEQLRFFVNTHYAVVEGASEQDMHTANKLHTAISTLDALSQSIET